jgi:SPP1 family predicted phage head-tail adaptor
MYTASYLRQNIEFLALSRSSDGGGGRSSSWSSLFPPVVVPAKVEPLSSREREISGQTATTTALKIVIRWRPGLTQDMRIKYGEQEYLILGMVNVDNRSTWIEIEAEQRFEEESTAAFT